MAFFLAALLFSSQALGQTTLGQILSAPEANDSSAIVLAQNDSARTFQGWPGEIDIDPPVIDHEALLSGVSGQTQDFTAEIVDDRGLEHVLLFYRDRSGAQYESVEMQSAEGTDNYQAAVETSLGQTRIEYYIEALDTGGNRVLKGFPFFPLVRELTPATANVSKAPEPESSDNRLVYVLLGVAAVGVALAVANSGSDSGDGPNNGGGEETPGTVPLNIIVSPP